MESDPELLAFLQQQLQWHQQQDAILALIEQKLLELKQIAEYRKNTDVLYIQLQFLISKTEELKSEVFQLEQQLAQIPIN